MKNVEEKRGGKVNAFEFICTIPVFQCVPSFIFISLFDVLRLGTDVNRGMGWVSVKCEMYRRKKGEENKAYICILV